MPTTIRIEEPSRAVPDKPGWDAAFSYAFRPFYLLAAAQAALFVALWAFGIGGSQAIPGFLWHGHEMIWGYAGAIIVGFLLTAAASWTGQPPMRGAALAGLVLVWLLARVALLAVPGSNLPGGLLSVLFFVAAAVCLALPIVRTRNTRNYVVILLLLMLAAANLVFHLALAGLIQNDLRAMLHVGLLLVAVVIFFMGTRVIAFFTSRGLQIPQVTNNATMVVLSVGLPLGMAIGVAVGAHTWLVAAVGVTGGLLNLIQLGRWWHSGALRVPLLWVLFAGYGCTALGTALYGLAYAILPGYMSTALHVIAVGGIGVLTLGMMTRTALGHTGRPLQAPSPLPFAFGLLLLATVLRLVAGFWMPSNPELVIASGLVFSAAFCLFLFRLGPWLAKPRADGRP